MHYWKANATSCPSLSSTVLSMGLGQDFSKYTLFNRFDFGIMGKFSVVIKKSHIKNIKGISTAKMKEVNMFIHKQHAHVYRQSDVKYKKSN